MNWMDKDRQVMLGTYQRMPFVPSYGEGCFLYDDNEEKYLDLFSGLGVNALGHRHRAVIRAGKDQMEKYLHISNFFYCREAVELAEALVDRSFPGKVFFTNSGTEGIEAAFKYLVNAGEAKNRRGIVTVDGSFHGRTLGALGLTGIPSVTKNYPVPEYPVYQVPRGDLSKLQEVFQKHRPVALMMEPISGSGGIEVSTEDEIAGIAELCRAYDVLLCFDEIQTGIGRSGRFFAYQHYPVEPDLVVFAKAVGGGLPLGGILVRRQQDGYFSPGDHGTTFGPSPVSAAMGRAVLQVMDDEFLAGVEDTGDWLIKELQGLKARYPEALGEIRGKGLMIGVDLKIDPGALKEAFFTERILVNITAGTVLRLLPPLIVTKDELSVFLRVFERIIKSFSQQ